MSDNIDNIIDEQLDVQINKNVKPDVDSVNNDIDKKLIEHYKNAEHVSIIPLLKLIYLTNGIDLSKEFKLKHSLTSNDADKLTAGELILYIPQTGENLDEEASKKKIKVSLGIVDKEYDLLESINNKNIFQNNIDTLQIAELKSDELISPEDKLKKTIISAISFLTQACLVCFNMIKHDNKDLLEYTLMLDDNTTIYLDNEVNKRIGILFN